MAGSDLVAGRWNLVELLPKGTARTVAYNSPILVNHDATQLIVTLVTWTVGTASLTLSIKEVTPVDFVATTLLSSAAINTDTVTRLRISPHLTAAANSIAKEIVPKLFQISIAVGNANPADYQLSYQLCP